MQIYRDILKEIEPQLEKREIIVITGMRRVGKTTLLQMMYQKIENKNKVFIDLGNILDQKIFEEIDYSQIWANLKAYGITNREKAYIFLDEIQAKPEIVKPIKYLYDHYDVKFILTGSSSFYLKNYFPESLAGRKITFELYPLSFKEFLRFKGVEKETYANFKDKEHNKNRILFHQFEKFYSEYLKYGGFPQVVLTEEESQKKIYLKDIFNSYFEMDVRRMADFRQINAFRDLLLLLLQRVGAKLEISKLASELGISRDTVYSYLSFLQATYFIFLLSPFSRNVDREVSGTKKVYFCDNGIISLFGKVTDGSLLENAVFHNLRFYGNVFYYQKRSGAEIDFILTDIKTALEVKLRGTEKDLSKLKRISDSLALTENYIVSKKFSSDRGIVLAHDV
ncbi:ATP-binding protein [candidate division KSB1 bacterium]|nr:ATP-binding protein [candidate division KSB1 bacterium]